jgi:tRNA G37 N-methylase Trm5
MAGILFRKKKCLAWDLNIQALEYKKKNILLRF